MVICLSCTCFPADSWNSNKSHHIFVCVQYPVFGHGKGRGPAEISFTNRWELVGPLGWEARFSRFSQERCRIYWFSGEKKITIQTSSLQFLGACRKSHSIYVIAPCRELFLVRRYVWLESKKMMDVLHICHLCFHKQDNFDLFHIKTPIKLCGIWVRVPPAGCCCWSSLILTS